MNRIVAMIGKLGQSAKTIGVLLCLVLAFYLGAKLTESPTPPTASVDHEAMGHEMEAETPSFWTCSMHLQIKKSEPGNCPICNMELIPVESDEGEEEERRLVMSAAAVKLAEIQTTPVERRFADARIRMVGKIDYDETRVRTISSYVPGRIDRLYVNFTGIEVRKKDHLALIYSPDLLTAQEELLEAKRRVEGAAKETSEFLRGSDKRALQSAREKLRLLGFSKEQIENIEEKNAPEDQMLITAPLGGIVVEKNVNEGDYVQTGTAIYTVADLSKIWVKLDAYEPDVPWLHYGQHVDLQVEAYPGEHFDGIIAFIDPILDPRTRTIKIRVNVENPDRRLKPGMFVRATVHSRIAKAGKIMDPDLAGKWIGPMHPEIVSDSPDDCPVCGMKLVLAEELGYVRSDDDNAKPLVVPVTAVLKTGRRAVVYVEVPDAERPTFEGRVITLGPRAGDFYLVKDGLREGDRVVTHGSFNIDSALQIQARPSMLSMEGESHEEEGDIATFRTALTPVFNAYFNAQEHLANDDLVQAKAALQHLPRFVDSVDMTLLSGDAHDAWMAANRMLKRAAADFASAEELEDARAAFALASLATIDLEKRFGHGGNQSHFEIFCPMAFEDGAPWLQLGRETRNPYFGAEMLTCGNIAAEHEPRTAQSPAVAGGHQH